MTNTIDPLDARLLDIVQAQFPLGPRPFATIGDRLSIAADDVIDRLARLESAGIVREISAIFDSNALGYRSALVALKIAEARLDEVASAIAAHPGVSHCYSRDSEFNLWFTITLPPGREIEQTVNDLTAREGVGSCLILPAVKTFKIGVLLSMTGERLDSPTRVSRDPGPAKLDEPDRAAVSVLQDDLPLIDRPFAELASRAGLTEDSLLQATASLLDRGVMRRYGAVLRHVRAGYRANAMVCWRVEPALVDRIGAAMSAHSAVSHCYERPACAEWPYSLYTMVHTRDDSELRRAIEELAGLAGAPDHRVLRTVREYKKSRVRYAV